MKKMSFKNLKLNKNSVSNLGELKGGFISRVAAQCLTHADDCPGMTLRTCYSDCYHTCGPGNCFIQSK
jgi:hypothetical protein